MMKVPARGLGSALKRIGGKPFAIIIDGAITRSVIKSAEESGIKALAAKNFATTDTSIELLSF